MLTFPYGMSDFYRIRMGDLFYVDRTSAIPELENAGTQLLFLRPRRFGKSLLLSLLENYYDLLKADDFERLFAPLAIGQNPTALHNRYLIMRWDFSTVEAHDDYHSMRASLFNHINNAVARFTQRYAQQLSVEVQIYPDDAIASFSSAANAAQQSGYPMYLLVDEYDNFANEVLIASRDVSREEGRKRYEELVRGEGVFKTVFKAVKAASQGMGLERVFITGVSPVVMADMSSGYNVSENIYLLRQFNTLCGFTQSEVVDVVQKVAAVCGFSAAKVQEAVSLMRTFYNGYRFHVNSSEMVYNPTLVLYFLKALQRDCQYPDEILDNNLAMDRNRIVYISQLEGAESLITDALDEHNPLVISSLAQRFGVAEMLAPRKNLELLTALLYYLGVLTLGGRDELGQIRLFVPNLVIRKLYAERLRELFLPDARAQDMAKDVAKALYQNGEMQPLCDFVEQKLLAVLDNRDYLQANELTIKIAFLSLLFEDHFFIVDSEPAIQRGYGDLILIVRPDMRQYKLLDVLLEFKFIKLSDLQLNGSELRQKSAAELATHPIVLDKFQEARQQLQQYRSDLSAQYGDRLHLRTFAVVALGFERLVWQEIFPSAS